MVYYGFRGRVHREALVWLHVLATATRGVCAVLAVCCIAWQVLSHHTKTAVPFVRTKCVDFAGKSPLHAADVALTAVQQCKGCCSKQPHYVTALMSCCEKYKRIILLE